MVRRGIDDLLNERRRLAMVEEELLDLVAEVVHRLLQIRDTVVDLQLPSLDLLLGGSNLRYR